MDKNKIFLFQFNKLRSYWKILISSIAGEKGDLRTISTKIKRCLVQKTLKHIFFSKRCLLILKKSCLKCLKLSAQCTVHWITVGNFKTIYKMVNTITFLEEKLFCLHCLASKKYTLVSSFSWQHFSFILFIFNNSSLQHPKQETAILNHILFVCFILLSRLL